MKKLLLLLLVIALILGGCGDEAAAEESNVPPVVEEVEEIEEILVRITAEELNLRDGIGTSTNIVGTLKKGEVVQVLDVGKADNGKIWLGIEADDGRSGWIASWYTEHVQGEDLVAKMTPDQAPAAEAPATENKGPSSSNNDYAEEMEMLAYVPQTVNINDTPGVVKYVSADLDKFFRDFFGINGFMDMEESYFEGFQELGITWLRYDENTNTFKAKIFIATKKNNPATKSTFKQDEFTMTGEEWDNFLYNLRYFKELKKIEIFGADDTDYGASKNLITPLNIDFIDRVQFEVVSHIDLRDVELVSAEKEKLQKRILYAFLAGVDDPNLYFGEAPFDSLVIATPMTSTNMLRYYKAWEVTLGDFGDFNRDYPLVADILSNGRIEKLFYHGDYRGATDEALKDFMTIIAEKDTLKTLSCSDYFGGDYRPLFETKNLEYVNLHNSAAKKHFNQERPDITAMD